MRKPFQNDHQSLPLPSYLSQNISEMTLNMYYYREREAAVTFFVSLMSRLTRFFAIVRYVSFVPLHSGYVPFRLP